MAVQRGGGGGGGGGGGQQLGTTVQSNVPVWNGSDSLQLADDFVRKHGLDPALAPTVGRLIAAEVRNWVVFETKRQASGRAICLL